MSFAEFLLENIHNGTLVTFIISMIPVIELRGAIPFGVASGMSHLSALIVSVIGNIVPVPFIIIFIRSIFRWMREHMPRLNGLVERLEAKAESKRGFVAKWGPYGLIVFVAIPLPGTGAWTGALIAAMLDIRLKSAMPAISLGVLIAGFIVTAITYGITGIFA